MQTKLNDILNDAVAVTEGNKEKAKLLYDSILSKDPEHSYANHNKGVLSFEDGQFNEALPFLRKASKIDPQK